MATRAAVPLTTAWVVVYNAATTGDFSGIIQQVGGAGDAIIHISTSAPPAGDAGIVVDGGLSVALTQASGLKIYGRSNSGSAVVVMTTNAGLAAADIVPAATTTGNVASGTLTQADGATAIDISSINRSALQIALEVVGTPTTGALTITGRPRGLTDYVAVYNAAGAVLTMGMTTASAVVIDACNFDSILVTPASYDGTSYSVTISGL